MAQPLKQDYRSQEIANEIKNSHSPQELIQIDLSLESKTYLAYKYKVANRDKLLKKLKRANPHTTKLILQKSHFISKQAVELAETVFSKLLNGKRVLLNHKYISKITGCNSTDQNKRILDQLSNLLLINYHRLAIVDGIPYNYHYSFELHPAIIEEIKDAGLWNLEFMPAEMRLSYNNRLYIFSKNIYRSNAHAHEAKFFNNSNSSNSLSEQAETIETKKLTTEPFDTKALISKKKSLANTRKKVTNSERVIRYHRFKAYDNPKNLSQHYPLSQEDCYELQKRSGKAYNLNAMNEILLDMSRKSELQGHSFISKAKFMCYMTKAYQEEGRDVDKANVHSFKIVKRRPQAEIKEIVTLNQREKYLNEAENSGIFARCDYTQFRAKIAGQFPINLGYDVLTSMIAVKKKGEVLEVTMHKSVEITEHYRQLLLNHAKGIGEYSGVDELEFKAL